MENQDQAGDSRTAFAAVAPRVPRGPEPAGPRTDLRDFARRVVVAVLVAGLILGAAYLMWRGVHVLLQAFAGVLFAVFLSALSQWLSRRTGISYGWALAAVVTAFFLLAGGLGWLLASVLAVQLGELSKTLPEALKQIRNSIAGYPWGGALLEQVPRAAESLAAAGDFSRVTGFVSGVANFLVTAVVILVVGIFGAAEPEVYRAGLLHLVPPPHRPRVRQAVDAVAFNLHWWLLGQVFLMVVIGVTTAVGLGLMGIPLALTLGLIAGLLELVPYIGPWLSVIPAALVALMVSPAHLLMTLGLYLGLHILEGYILLPLVQRRTVLLPPALTLIMQVLLGDLLGVMGLLVAAPLTVSALVLLKMLYVEDTLGDQAVNVPGEPEARYGDTATRGHGDSRHGDTATRGHGD